MGGYAGPAPRLNIASTQFAAIDFEGAGSAPGRSEEPVQVAIAHLAGGTIRKALNSYVKPGCQVTWAAKKVHGISDEMVAGAPPLASLWPDIKRAMEGRWVVAHGAATEKRFLRAFPFHSFGPWVDTLQLVRAAYPALPSHALGDAICALQLDRDPAIAARGFRWHDAESDAIASLVLLRHLIADCRLGESDPRTLLRPDLTRYFSGRRR